MSRRLRIAVSHFAGWLADRRIPTALRAPTYRTYARITGADLSEVRPPLSAYASLSAFFVRRLVEGARPLPEDPAALASPVDGTLQALDKVHDGSLLQAKGHTYGVRELLGNLGQDVDLEGATSWTVYLSPRDYHRIHAPVDCELKQVHWIPGDRHSVQPKVLARRTVFPINERCVLMLESARGPFFLVLVGALNVGRIRVLGVEPGQQGALSRPRPFDRGEELARFEMGSTIILITPRGQASAAPGLALGARILLGQSIGHSS
ncbi:MAG: phosphatidylserine decarboxylase [Chlamydiales bacterium]